MFQSSDISYHIITLGCAKNLVDSERSHGLLLSSGFRFAENPDDADIVIINTCGFIEDAKRESIDVIFDALHDRDRYRTDQSGGNNPALGSDHFQRRVVVTGCLSQRYPVEIREEIPEIDLVYGLLDEQFVPVLADRFDIAVTRGHFLQEPLSPAAYRYIKISEGCSNNCSYCAIPLIRGPHISAPVESILEDCRRAVEGGAVELILVAQDGASYHSEGNRLPSLVERIAALDGVRWIRLLYLHPDRLDTSIINLVRDNEKVVKYMDIPFQHASSRILQSMGRAGDFRSYRALVEQIREAVPEVRIRSTFMVGYPGEEEEDFGELMRFITTLRLDRVGCFMYSPEENTRAALLGDTVPRQVKEDRYGILMEKQREISQELMNRFIGREIEVLVEEQVDPNTWIGRTEYDAPEVDGVFFLTADSVSITSIVKATVVDAMEYDLIGMKE